MNERMYSRASRIEKSFLGISNPLMTGMGLSYMCIALWAPITTFSLKPRPVNSQRSCSLSTVHTERDLPILREMIDRPGLETIEQAVDSKLQNNANLARQVKMFLCHRYSGKKLSEIGARFGVSESAVTQASRRMRDKQHKDKKIEKLILKIGKKLPLSIAMFLYDPDVFIVSLVCLVIWSNETEQMDEVDSTHEGVQYRLGSKKEEGPRMINRKSST